VADAVGRWDDPPSGFRADLRSYLDSPGDDWCAPLARREDGRLEVAADS